MRFKAFECGQWKYSSSVLKDGKVQDTNRLTPSAGVAGLLMLYYFILRVGWR